MSVVVFLLGSVPCGLARGMMKLLVFLVRQGLYSSSLIVQVRTVSSDWSPARTGGG